MAMLADARRSHWRRPAMSLLECWSSTTPSGSTPASAALVHQVVSEGVCRTVVTVRSGEPAPDAIESLWTGGWARRIDLRGLSLAETGELLPSVLGGAGGRGDAAALWETSGGTRCT